MKITFLGAAQTVTGSSYLVETDRHKFLIDCGMFQGPDVEGRNYEEFSFDPKELDFMILTHAHIDHSGLIPKLFRKGFRGEVYLSVPTGHLAEILLLDAAKIQESNQEHGEVRKLIRSGTEDQRKALERSAGLLYSSVDAINAIDNFTPFKLDTETELRPGIKSTFINAGHILGAVSVILEIDGKKILFSGDIGHKEQRLVVPFDTELKYRVDYIIMESLYGGVEHEERKKAEQNLIDHINTTLSRNGNVMIPAFSVQRTQELLYIFKRAKEEGHLQHNVQIFLDSPLGLRATKIYTSNISYLNQEVQSMTKSGNNPFSFPRLKIIDKHKESLGLFRKRPCIIIAGSGMANGGRILNHLAVGLQDRKSSVLFVGYQAEETLGRLLTQGAKKVKISKRGITVNAQVELIDGFSAHADNSDLLEFVARADKATLKKVFLVHAEVERSKNFKNKLDSLNISSHIPAWKETIEI